MQNPQVLLMYMRRKWLLKITNENNEFLEVLF
jgi:hypothetical protein